MSLKFKKKIYLSLDLELLNFVEQESNRLDTTRAGYIREFLIEEYKKQTKINIDKIIEGKTE